MAGPVSRNDIARVALGLLARREYTGQQLSRKLLQRFSEHPQWIAEVLEDFTSRGYLSDTRYLQIALRQHLEQGHGPLRIRASLKEKGIGDREVEAALEALAVDWEEQAAATRARRFKTLPSTPKDKAQQLRFLQYRGFTLGQSLAALKTDN